MAEGDDKIGTKEKIQILLAEYNTLRAEILQRNTVLNQFLIFSIATMLGLVGGLAVAEKFAVSIGSFVLLTCMIVVVFRIVMSDTRRVANRIRQLEARINGLAGEKLLEWESEHGLMRIGKRSF